MTIGFTGTRQIDKISEGRLSLLAAWLEMYSLRNQDIPGVTVVHGCAYGADTFVHERCLQYNIPIIGRPTYNRNSNLTNFMYLYLPEAPLIRNKKIVDNCDILIALPIDKDVEELRSGTWATIRYARKLNKKIIII